MANYLSRFKIITLGAMIAFSGMAHAQEISQSHLDAALKASVLVNASSSFDRLLPNAALQIKNVLIRQRPDLQTEIITATDKIALDMSDRTIELNLLVAKRWAARLSEEELGEIITFYSTETGKKYASVNNRLIGDTLEEGTNWSRAVGDDMLKLVREELAKQGYEF